MKCETMHTKTVFIPHADLVEKLNKIPGKTLEQLEDRLGVKCSLERNHQHPQGGEVMVVVVEDHHASIKGLWDKNTKNDPWWLE